jgi:predicted  nucleic acid-binding Zn-ribbon protein
MSELETLRKENAALKAEFAEQEKELARQFHRAEKAEARIRELMAELIATKGALNSTLRTKLFAKKEAP